MTLTQAIQVEARHLGFALIGVTTPAPPLHYRVFEQWLDAGKHAGMAYLDTQPSRLRRADPRLIMPDCRSILILGLRYSPSPEETALVSSLSPDTGEKAEFIPYRGNIASYAWGEDYHLNIPVRLKALIAFIESQIGKAVPHYFYTDSGPILERDLAQRAGLGWIGKNTNLINPQVGSYLLLAEILLGIDLEISPPFDQDRCGTCQRCLEACPTGCILPNRTLDASRCISYLTIELKEAIPTALRTKLGGWVFGCDICQQVCPWNRRIIDPIEDEAFTPRPGISHPDLIETLSLTPESFARHFRGSPIKRAKRAGFLRNAAVVLGNRLVGFPAYRQRSLAIIKLTETLQRDTHPLVRGHAAWALGRADERKILRQASRLEKDPMVLEEIHYAETM